MRQTVVKIHDPTHNAVISAASPFLLPILNNLALVCRSTQIM
jgi:hypothetical protein